MSRVDFVDRILESVSSPLAIARATLLGVVCAACAQLPLEPVSPEQARLLMGPEIQLVEPRAVDPGNACASGFGVEVTAQVEPTRDDGPFPSGVIEGVGAMLLVIVGSGFLSVVGVGAAAGGGLPGLLIVPVAAGLIVGSPIWLWHGISRGVDARYMDRLLSTDPLPKITAARLRERLPAADPTLPPDEACFVNVRLVRQGVVRAPVPAQSWSDDLGSLNGDTPWYALVAEAEFEVRRGSTRLHADRVLVGVTARSRDAPPPRRATFSELSRDEGSLHPYLEELGLVLAAIVERRVAP